MGSYERTIQCFSCSAPVPDTDGPVHRTMDSSPGCWAVFGEVLAREYSDYNYASHHRLTVDAYAVQHPGKPFPQSIGSAAVHLASLCLVLERRLPMDYATCFMKKLTKHKSMFFWLEPPSHMGPLTVLDVWEAEDAVSHIKAVSEWASSAWSAWEEHHDQIRKWIDACT